VEDDHDVVASADSPAGQHAGLGGVFAVIGQRVGVDCLQDVLPVEPQVEVTVSASGSSSQVKSNVLTGASSASLLGVRKPETGLAVTSSRWVEPCSPPWRRIWAALPSTRTVAE